MSQVEHFDRLAGRYDTLRAPPGVTAVHEPLAREIDLAGKRVLDVGCGTGANLLVLEQHFGCRPAGVDSSQGMLDEARRKLPTAELRSASRASTRSSGSAGGTPPRSTTSAMRSTGRGSRAPSASSPIRSRYLLELLVVVATR